MKEIKAILFDLGNVLVKLAMEKAEEGYSEYADIKEGNFVEYLLDSQNMNRYMEGELTSSQFYGKTKRLFRMRDIKYHDFYEIFNSMFLPYPEMEELIKKIKEKYPQIKLVLLSNTCETHYEYIKENFTVLELLDDHVVSHEVGRQKPHPDIFKEGLKIAGSIPKNTFYTDDREDLIKAARVMGIRAHLFTDHKALIADLAECGIDVC